MAELAHEVVNGEIRLSRDPADDVPRVLVVLVEGAIDRSPEHPGDDVHGDGGRLDAHVHEAPVDLAHLAQQRRLSLSASADPRAGALRVLAHA